MGSLQEMINAKPVTGRKILVVGAGTAGMLLALECKRLGWDPMILERRESAQMAGDFIVIGPSAVKIFRHWPRLRAEYDQKSHFCDAIFNRHNGERVLGPLPLKSTVGKPMLRQDLQNMLETAVDRSGIPIRFNCKVASYYGTESEGGVELEDGQRLSADVVAACDGVDSNNSKQQPINSGHAVYRTAVPTKQLFEADPSLKERFECKDNRPCLEWFSGPDTHALVFCDGETICWSVHHPANANTSSESWSALLSGKVVEDQMLQQQPDWYPLLLSMVQNTSDQSVSDWLLMYRDSDPQWVSPKGRVVQCGDSAHPFLPTSANGAVQAMEDAVSLASALQLGLENSASIPESLQVFNQIRFPRTSCAQLMGMVHRQIHHKTDWDVILKNPKMLSEGGPGRWVADHDPEIFLQENFVACLESVRQGKVFSPKNTPPGYRVRPWSCQHIFEREKTKGMLALEGDWL